MNLKPRSNALIWDVVDVITREELMMNKTESQIDTLIETRLLEIEIELKRLWSKHND